MNVWNDPFRARRAAGHAPPLEQPPWASTYTTYTLRVEVINDVRAPAAKCRRTGMDEKKCQRITNGRTPSVPKRIFPGHVSGHFPERVHFRSRSCVAGRFFFTTLATRTLQFKYFFQLNSNFVATFSVLCCKFIIILIITINSNRYKSECYNLILINSCLFSFIVVNWFWQLTFLLKHLRCTIAAYFTFFYIHLFFNYLKLSLRRLSFYLLNV